MTKSRTAPPELLAVLGRATARKGLGFAAAPTLVPGGNETSVFGFRLSGVPQDDPWSGELILRVYDREQLKSSIQHRLETAVHGFLCSKGYPVPEILHSQDAGDGPAWVVMTRLPGAPLGSDALRLPGSLFRLLSRLREASATMTDLREQLHAIDAALLREALAANDLTVPGIDGWIRQTRERIGAREPRLRAALDKLENVLTPWQARAPQVVCHYDFHPLNILVTDSRVSGVIDWGGTTIAPREFDIGNTAAVLTLVSIDVPIGIGQLLQAALRRLVRMYVESAEPVDHRKLNEVIALRALVELVGMRDRAGHEGDLGSWHEGKLVRAIKMATGIGV